MKIPSWARKVLYGTTGVTNVIAVALFILFITGTATPAEARAWVNTAAEALSIAAAFVARAHLTED